MNIVGDSTNILKNLANIKKPINPRMLELETQKTSYTNKKLKAHIKIE